jgi:PAS domain S-box-containing protein
MLLLGRGLWPAVAVGAFLVNVTTTGAVWSSIAIAAGNTIEAVIGAAFVERYAGGSRAFERPETVLAYTLGAGVLACAISATIGTLSLVVFGHAAITASGPLWLTWWLGDLGGAVVVAPFIVLWAIHPTIRWRGGRVVEAAALLLGLWITAHAVFGGWLSVRGMPIMYLVVPWLVWAAFRFGPRETSTALALLAGILILGSIQGHGPFADTGQHASLLVLQGFVVVFGPTLLTLTAGITSYRETHSKLRRAYEQLETRVRARTRQLAEANCALQSKVEEHAAMVARLRQSEDQLRTAQRMAKLGAWSWDVRTDVLDWSEELCQIYGVPATQVGRKFEDFLDRVPAEHRAQTKAMVAEIVRSPRAFEYYHEIVRPDGVRRMLLSRVDVQLDASGTVQRMFGCCMDVTEIKHTEDALRRAQDELERRVEERTKELARVNAQLLEKIEQLEQFEAVVVGRELKMIELERKLETLRRASS